MSSECINKLSRAVTADVIGDGKHHCIASIGTLVQEGAEIHAAKRVEGIKKRGSQFVIAGTRTRFKQCQAGSAVRYRSGDKPFVASHLKPTPVAEAARSST